MKRNFIALCALLLAACGSQEPKITLFSNEAFQTEADGKPVGIYTLRAGDVTMQVTNYGARVVSLWTPDRAGDYEDIVLGYETIDRYINNDGERFLGAVVGPYANRIAKGSFTLDGTEYNLPINNNGQTLHGGIDGLDRVVWDVHHPFFNLKGEGNGTILDHVMTINASHTTPVDSVLIPTGEIADVTGTPFDFRQPHAIGERIGADNEQLRNGAGYDHNWVLDRKTADGIEPAATVWEPASGRTIEVLTDQPAMQFYSGNFFDGKANGKYGKPLRYRESLALETQKYPDSPNHDNFPSTVLRPGEEYTQVCIYRFGVK